jgi:S-adenosylmethionine:tRNA ribosyltransferase-isomerase
VRTSDFNYHLPAELIAQHPAAKRDASRILVFDRASKSVSHKNFSDFPTYLRKTDLLVVNNSRVLPARLRAEKPNTGGAVEVLLVEEIKTNEWWTMLRPGKRVRAGSPLIFKNLKREKTDIAGEVQEKSPEGHYRIVFHCPGDIKTHLDALGEIPLPPYIERPEGLEPEDSTRYQTVFAQPPGSVAAPTAGLHFTPELLESIRAMGVNIAEVTLHVGLGTFAPVKAENLAEHPMHEERYEILDTGAALINQAREAGHRVICVGTTSLRVVESVAATHGRMVAGRGKTRIFIYPPFHFRVADALLTNFHLPESTLLMLVSAFAAPGKVEGRELILNAYSEAVRERYRFFSFGDAMLIL